MRSLLLAATLCGACALASTKSAPGAAAERSGLTPLQVMRLRHVRSVHPSPDGSRIAFVRSEPRLADAAEPGPAPGHLWIVPAAGGDERLLVASDRGVSGIRWRPDGAWLTFLERRGDDQHPQIHALPMEGGEPIRLTDVEGGVADYEWRPDGRALAYTATDPLPPARKDAEKLGFKQIVVEEGWTHRSLHLWDLESRQSRRLTEGRTVEAFRWTRDGSRLAAAIAPRHLVDDSYMFQRIFAIDPASSSVDLLVDNPGKLGGFAWSPDGARLAYIGAEDVGDPHAGMLYVCEVATRAVRPLTPGYEGMVHQVHFLSDDELLLCVSEGVQTKLARLDLLSGALAARPSDGLAFRGFEPSGAGTVAVAGSRAEHPAEAFVGDAAGHGGFERRTDSNPWLAGVALGRQETYRYAARDGLPIEGLLLYPIDHVEGALFPLVVVAHGGPESHFDEGWSTDYGRWGQALSARGYFVWFPNYRSSTGRGVAFAKMDHGDPMGREFEDHLDAIDALARRGLIDRSRVGIGGGSYGGYTAAWAATRHSEDFAAAVSFVPFVDIRTKWYTSDIPWEFYFVHYQQKWPHEQQEFLASRSPLSHAPKCRTPLLLLGGTNDTRVHPSQPFMLYRAVQTSTRTPVRYVQYPGEGHGNRSTVYQYDFLVRTLQWFDHYLRPGDHRTDPPPPCDLDVTEWSATKEKKEAAAAAAGS